MSIPNYLIICAGSTVKEYKDRIDKYVEDNNFIKLGVNNVTHLFNIDRHLWTNYRRFKNFFKGDCCDLILSENIVKRVYDSNMFGICDLNIKTEIIYDNINIWRTAGIRAIQYVADKGQKVIDVVGMDGYTLLNGGNQHCYGKGYTDIGRKGNPGELINRELNKDDIVYTALKRMRSNGMFIRILTPTVFKEFHFGGVL